MMRSSAHSHSLVVRSRDWADVIRLLTAHDLAPLLYYRLERADALGVLTEKQRVHLKRLFEGAEARSRDLMAHLFDTIHSFQKNDIDVLVLKGAHLATSIYECPSLRPMKDIDLLVRMEDLGRVEHLLVGTTVHAEQLFGGKLKKHHLPRIINSRGVAMEIHWHVHPDASDLRLDIQEIWRRSQQIEVNGMSIQVMCPEDLVVHLATHAVRHRFKQSLRWLVDIYLTLDKHRNNFKWSRLIELANRSGAAGHVYLCLCLCQHLLDCTIPDCVLKALTPKEFIGCSGEVLCRLFVTPRLGVMPSAVRQLVDRLASVAGAPHVIVQHRPAARYQVKTLVASGLLKILHRARKYGGSVGLIVFGVYPTPRRQARFFWTLRWLTRTEHEPLSSSAKALCG